MSDAELEKIVDAIRTGCQLRSESIAGHVRLLRSIEITALREAREIAERHPGWDGENPALSELDKQIRESELR